MHTLFTLGYQAGIKLPALAAWLEAHDALLVDIRLTPWSKQPDWTAERLGAALGEGYLHLPDLGNLNYNGALGVDKGIVIADLDVGALTVSQLLHAAPVVLLCGCWNQPTCHRTLVAEHLQRTQGVAVQHLTKADLPGGAPPAATPSTRSYLWD